MAASSEKKRIVILGGGVGGMTAACQLTSKPGWENEYEIEVYQVGHRLGGKGASGRNSRWGQRIEEHGLHVWMGFYFNAFRMMDECYRELDRPEGAPLRTIWDAFKPQNLIVWEQKIDPDWVHWPFTFPPNERLPTDGTGFPSPFGILVQTAKRALDAWEGSEHQHVKAARATGRVTEKRAPESSGGGIAGRVKGALGRAAHLVEEGIERIVEGAEGLVAEEEVHLLLKKSHDDLAKQLEKGVTPRPEHVKDVSRKLRKFLKWLFGELEKHLETDPELRRLVVGVELCVVCMIGMIEDRVLWDGYDVIDEWDLLEWCRRHGGTKWLLESAPMRALYDMLFAFEKGDTTSLDNCNMAAGVALRGAMRMTLCYNGSIFYKMQAGMGDTVFGPFHEVLERRGVKFHFFHKVENLGLSEDHSSVDQIDIQVQATLKEGTKYDPYVEVKGLKCWPTEPRYEQLVEGEDLAANRIDLTSNWTPWKGVGQKTLKVGEDFDQVILAIPPGAFRQICPELLAASEAWRTMVDEVKTVQTQALQIWIDRDLGELGWDLPSPVMSSYQEPLDTWADMSHLIVRELWPTHKQPGSIAYFCGPMKDADVIPQPDAHEFPAMQLDRVRTQAEQLLDECVGHLWPDGAPPNNSKGLDRSLLHDPENRPAAERLRAQFWKCNIDPSERYVMSPKKTTQLRLSSNEKYFGNLFVSGDWTRNGISAGCVESAVMSGMQCSRRISGYPEVVIGETDFPDQTSVPQQAAGEYIWRPDDITLTGPAAQKSAKLDVYLLRGTKAAVQGLLDRTINKPKLGQDRYVAIVDQIILSKSDIGVNYCLRPEYRRIGWTQETDWAFFIPVAVLKRKNGNWFTDRLGCFVSNCFVNQPYALVTGRNFWGFPKTMAEFSTDGNTEVASTWVLEKFDPETKLELKPVIKITNDGEPKKKKLESGSHAWSELVTAMGAVDRPDFDFFVNLIEDLADSKLPLVFLKQMRACAPTEEAVYQAVIEADSVVKKFISGHLMEGNTTIELLNYDSQPFSDELGTPKGAFTPTARMEVVVDFDMNTAARIWDSVRKQ